MVIWAIKTFPVYSCQLLISSASIRSILFLSFIVPIFSLHISNFLIYIFSNFLEEISSLPFYCFPIFLCIVHLTRLSYFSLFFGTLYLNGCIFPFLLCLSLLFSAICKSSSDNHFAFLHFFFFGMVLITTSCTMLQTCVHNSSGTLSDLIPWIYLSLPLYNHKGFDVGHTWMT